MATSSPGKEQRSYEGQEKKGTLTLLNLNIFRYNKTKNTYPDFDKIGIVVWYNLETDELVYYCSSTLLFYCNSLATVVCVNYH